MFGYYQPICSKVNIRKRNSDEKSILAHVTLAFSVDGSKSIGFLRTLRDMSRPSLISIHLSSLRVVIRKPNC